MTRTIDRHQSLRATLTAIQGQGPFMRAYHLPKLTDRQIAQAAWAAYQPAVPLNFAGFVFAGLGLVLGLAAVKGILRVLIWPFRRTRTGVPQL